MRTALRMGSAALALLGMTGQVLAGEGCARRDDRMAMRVAALQQELMVAALTCHAVARYNEFVRSYQPELWRSDDALKAYFIRASGSEDEYHAFKTRLANQNSMRSIHDGNYCIEASAAFDSTYGARTLNSAVMRTPVMMDDYDNCADSSAPR